MTGVLGSAVMQSPPPFSTAGYGKIRALVPEAVDGFKPTDEPMWPTGEVSILSGGSGAGKTTLLMQCLGCWQQGKLFAGFSGPAQQFGLLAADRAMSSYHKIAAQTGITNMFVRSLVDDHSIRVSDLESNPFRLLFTLLDSIRKELPKPESLIMVDPLMVFLGVDLNKYHLVASRLLQINRWCKDNQVCLIGTHHATKARTDWGFKRPQDRIAGSSALLGFTSTQGFLATPEEIDEKHFEWTIVSHHHAPTTLRLVRNDGALFQVLGAWPQTDAPPLNPLGANAQLVWNALLSNGPLSRKALIDSLEMSPSSVDRSLQLLLDQHFVTKVGYGQYQAILPPTSH